MPERHLDQINELIEIKQHTLEQKERLLAKSRDQLALYGGNIPPKRQIELEDLERDINKLQYEIDGLKREREQAIKTDVPKDLVPRGEQYVAPRDHHVSTGGIVYGVSIVVLAMIFILTDNFVVYPKMQEPVIFEQMIDPNFHHLGDNVYSQEYVNSIIGDKPNNLSPEGVSYTVNFDLNSIRRSANVDAHARINKLEITMFVNHVKSRRTAPILVGVNGEYLAHLNDYVKAEEFHREPVRILVDVPLYEGQNEIEIVTGKDTEQSVSGFDEYEDFEFDSLGIAVAFDEKHLKVWPFVLMVLGEVVVLGFMGVLLSRSIAQNL